MMRRNRAKKSPILSSPVTLLIALIVLVLLARSAARIHTKAAESERRLAEASASVGRLEAKQALLEGKIGSLSTPEGIEASIREKYHAAEPGEQVAVIVDKDEPYAASAAETAESAPRLTVWQRLLRAIGF